MQVDGKSAVERRIAGAFKAAADATGTSFDYLLKTAQRESDHRPDLAAKGSTAEGLFQFVDQTWLEMIRREGPSVGLERLADKITPDGKGGWVVSDPTDRAKIMSLKTDPLVSAVMAAKFTQDNARKLGDALGRTPTDGELYAAHVLGPAGAIRLFRLAATAPATGASVTFPRAAAANPGLFYAEGGRARTVAELFERLTRSPDAGADPTTARIAAIHGNLTATTSKTDAATVALLLRAQAAALVGTEKIGEAPTSAPPSAAARALFTVASSDVGMPGASEAAAAGRLDGWRAHVARDAFSGMMRDDGGAADADAALAAGRVLPGAAGGQSARASIAVARATASTGPTTPGGQGGIPLVDPTAPLALAPTTASAPLAALDRAVPETRPSRLVTAAATGAPAMPLPMVDAATGEVRPSRLLFEQWREPSDVTRDAGVVRVRTTTIMRPITDGSAAVASGASPAAAVPAAVPTTSPPPRRAAGTRAARVPPLDLFALARTGSAAADGE